LTPVEIWYLTQFAGLPGVFRSDLEQKALARLAPAEPRALAPDLLERLGRYVTLEEE
jgi:hypothetical protein